MQDIEFILPTDSTEKYNSLICNKLKIKIISRLFYGWLAFFCVAAITALFSHDVIVIVNQYYMQIAFFVIFVSVFNYLIINKIFISNIIFVLKEQQHYIAKFQRIPAKLTIDSTYADGNEVYQFPVEILAESMVVELAEYAVLIVNKKVTTTKKSYQAYILPIVYYNEYLKSLFQ